MRLLKDKLSRYILKCDYGERHIPPTAGFQWDDVEKVWFANSIYKAFTFADQADENLRPIMNQIKTNIQLSGILEPVVDYNMPYYPFQAAGIEVMADQLSRRKAVLCADMPGLGKTIESIGVANKMGLKKLLVVCPASLRLNWVREIEKWHEHSLGVDPILSGKDRVDPGRSCVVSYSLASMIPQDYKPDLVIVDEVHNVKNPEAVRTRVVLGNKNQGYLGLVSSGAPVILLSGTPTPNGKPSELWPTLYKLAPDAISHMRYWPFVREFCTWFDDGLTTTITGAKNTKELNVRLRGSGFMVRRDKADVLKDLPQKQYKMVVFPANSSTKKVLQREKDFSVEEILQHGVPVGSGLPEIRREMGVAKGAQCLEYIEDLLMEGGDKVVVFAHHLEVVGLLAEGLRRYSPVVITGSTSSKDRQKSVDRFQNDLTCRVFIGNEAAEEGLTLTAAHDVVMVEPEWVPGKNQQRADRLHRIGQVHGVVIHLLVVERSLDARILSVAAQKAADIEKILK